MGQPMSIREQVGLFHDNWALLTNSPIIDPATCYKTLKKVQKCLDCHLKAADCFKQNHSFYAAAK